MRLLGSDVKVVSMSRSSYPCDEGRTVPSLTGILGKQANVTELDVVNVDI